ncbi:MAG: XrtA/PEP-CTERM system exopolysaccharide export protein [Pseudomonadota bacterium]
MNFYTNLLARIALVLVVTTAPVALADALPSPEQASAPADAKAAPMPAVPEAGQADSTYIIGPGDTLQIFVWRQPELSVSVPVRPDGKVSTPLVEDIVAVGKTPSQLAREMEKVLSEYVRSPQVNVIVSQPVSTYSQVKIIGQVAKPSALPFRQGITALDAVLAVGGLAPFAAGNRAKVVRTEKGKQREIKIKLDDIINKGDMKQNILLQPGDVLVVPESRF